MSSNAVQHTSMHNRYIVISPAKDEAARIERTIQSMLKQTVKPVKWVIVDDGSTDATPQILESYRLNTDWMSVIRVNRDAQRKLGSAEIRAFETGFQSVQNEPFDFVVKLDCDLEFGPAYFERLLARFDENPRLGIASGVYFENHEGIWTEVDMPPYHASGASKVVRAQCFRDIGGFPLYPGWDTADEIKAQAHGWETRHFRDLRFDHLRKEGSAMGGLSTNVLHGHVFYVTNGGPFYFSIKAAMRMLQGKPPIIAGTAMVWGYLRAWLKGSPKLVDDAEAKFYRAQLKQRLIQPFKRGFHSNNVPEKGQGQA
ncbi:MAG TPA: glycosyltransferase family A protein [Methylomirabilota bacterium]|nr:glycosyltransferase family A protein [Methylomirabilota bacterium]